MPWKKFMKRENSDSCRRNRILYPGITDDIDFTEAKEDDTLPERTGTAGRGKRK